MTMISFTNSKTFKSLDGLKKEAIDMCLLYCGLEECEAGHRFGPNNRDSHLLHVVTEGRGTLEINGTTYHMNKNDAFYIPWGETAYYQADEREPWKYIWIGVSGIMAKETIRQAGFTDKVCVRTLKDENVARLHYFLDEMLLANQLTYANELKRLGLLMQYFAVLIDDFHESGAYAGGYSYPLKVYVSQAAEFMKQHYNENIRVTLLAREIGINRSYLSTGFRNVYGMSPKQYLTDLRMKKASALIKKGSESITYIARNVGYEDPLAFSKAFKEQFGLSPKQYRESKEEMITLKYKGEKRDVR